MEKDVEAVLASRRLGEKLEKLGYRVSRDAAIEVYTSDQEVLEACAGSRATVVVKAPRLLVMLAGLLRLPTDREGVIAARCREEPCSRVELRPGLLRLLRILFEMLMYTEVGRMARFAVVGASGVPVSVAAWLLLVRILGLAGSGGLHGYALPDFLASEAAIIWNFAWNEKWTFSDLPLPRAPLHVASRLAKYNAISLAGVALLILIHAGLMDLGLGDLDAYLLGILIVFVFNYALSRLIAWRPGSEQV